MAGSVGPVGGRGDQSSEVQRRELSVIQGQAGNLALLPSSNPAFCQAGSSLDLSLSVFKKEELSLLPALQGCFQFFRGGASSG